MSKELYLPKLKGLRKQLRHNMTNAEKYLWQYLRREQLGFKFQRQVSIGYFVVDFYCIELSLAIELDGEIHNEKIVSERDTLRQAVIEADGVVFLRFTNDTVFNKTEAVLLEIQNTCFELSKQLN